MTNSKTIKTTSAPRKSSAAQAPVASPLALSTLLLAAVVAFEVAGVRALPEAPADAEVVASLDGAAINAPNRTLRPAPVEVRIVAQADGYAR